MGRHSDWHEGTVLPPQHVSYKAGAAAETAADKKTAKYAPLVQIWALGTEVPQRGPGAVLVAVWGRSLQKP